MINIKVSCRLTYRFVSTMKIESEENIDGSLLY